VNQNTRACLRLQGHSLQPLGLHHRCQAQAIRSGLQHTANTRHRRLPRQCPSSLAVASVHSTLSSARHRSHSLCITVCVPQALTSHKARPRLLMMMMMILCPSKRSGCNISVQTAPVILVSCQLWSKQPALCLPQPLQMTYHVLGDVVW
jgi:hypothetical protein